MATTARFNVDATNSGAVLAFAWFDAAYRAADLLFTDDDEGDFDDEIE